MTYAELHLFGVIGQVVAVEDVQDIQPQLNRQVLRLQSASLNMQQLLVSPQAIGRLFGNLTLGQPKGQRATDDHNAPHETGEFHLAGRIR